MGNKFRKIIILRNRNLYGRIIQGLEYLVQTCGTLRPHLYAVPEEIDREVANIKLESLGVTIDRLSEEQIAYLNRVE